MRLTWLMRALAILFVAALASGAARAQAQDSQHIVSLDRGHKALESAKIAYARVDKAVGQLSDEDVAKLADRSRQVEKDFAAGSLSDRDLLIIVIIAVLVIALIAALH